MNIGKLYGIKIKINYWFFLIAGIFGLSGMIKEVMIVFFSVIIHEISHILMARCCNYKVDEVEILPFGGVAKIERFWERDKKKIFITTIVGPICSFVLGFVCLLFSSAEYQDFWKIVSNVNFALALFNLLPTFPLDGGHIARTVLMNFCPYKQATKYVTSLSFLSIFLIIIKIVYDLVNFQIVHISLGIFVVFIFFAIKNELRNSKFYTIKLMAYKKFDLLQQGCMETIHYTVLKDTKIKSITNLFVAERYTIIVVIDEVHHICGMFTEIQIWEALGERGICACFSDLLL